MAIQLSGQVPHCKSATLHTNGCLPKICIPDQTCRKSGPSASTYVRPKWLKNWTKVGNSLGLPASSQRPPGRKNMFPSRDPDSPDRPGQNPGSPARSLGPPARTLVPPAGTLVSPAGGIINLNYKQDLNGGLTSNYIQVSPCCTL